VGGEISIRNKAVQPRVIFLTKVKHINFFNHF
jgi:hypothetical protein